MSGPLLPDEATRQALQAFVRQPIILAASSDYHLVDNLKTLLSNGFDPNLVRDVTSSLLDQIGSEFTDYRTTRSATGADVVELALTLHRIPETRLSGLDLFERLLSLNLDAAEERLLLLDGGRRRIR